MYFKILSGTYAGPRAVIIAVEASADSGLPCFNLVGLPDAPARESRERIRAAFQNSGFRFPQSRVTVNLLPPDLRKSGLAHEAALAAAILGTQGLIDPEAICGTVVLGGIGLGGRLLPVKGILGYLAEAVSSGVERALIPEGNMGEARLIEGITVMPAGNMRDLPGILNGVMPARPDEHQPQRTRLYDVGGSREELTRASADLDMPNDISILEEDFSDIDGQSGAVRAATVAAAGGHNLLLLGPPGVGKTMIGRRVRGILPPLSRPSRVELVNLYGLAGILDEGSRGRLLKGERPMRSPHTGVTTPGLVGGGHASLPGEAALAHRGVLFLDEVCEIRRDTLEALRGPMSDRRVTISRPYMKVTYPCDMMVVAAANLCPCGNRGDDHRECRCSAASVRKYFSRISGAFLDRIEIRASLGRPAAANPGLAETAAWREDGSSRTPTSSRELKEIVCTARSMAVERYGLPEATNSNASPSRFSRGLNLAKTAEAILSKMAGSFGLDGRGRSRLLRVARTVADLDGADRVGEEHLLEAASHVRDPGQCVGRCGPAGLSGSGAPGRAIPWPFRPGTVSGIPESIHRRPFL